MPAILRLQPKRFCPFCEEAKIWRCDRESKPIALFWRAHLNARPIYSFARRTAEAPGDFAAMQDAQDRWLASLEQQQRMRQHAHALEIRLQGHRWDGMLTAFYDEGNGSEYLAADSKGSSEAAETAAETEDINPDIIDGKLKTLFEDLPKFEKLKDLLLQVGPSHEDDFKGPWTQIYASAFEKLVASVPKMSGLDTLTLDLFTGHLDDTSETVQGSAGYHIGLCKRIAGILPLVPVVRLRLRHSCSALFPTADQLSVLGQDVRLKSLVIKLHVPYGEGAPAFGGPFWCRWDKEARSPQHYADVVRGARSFLEQIASVRKEAEAGSARQKSAPGRADGPGGKKKSAHGMARLRISWPGAEGECCIETADVITDRVLAPGEGFFVYEDTYGDSWDLEERTDLVDCGSLKKRTKT